LVSAPESPVLDHAVAPPTGPANRPSTIRFRRTLFEEATEIMRAEYGSDLRVDNVARRIATSRRQLQRAFLETAGTTFREHLCAVRMEAAAALLRRPELTVGTVAHRVGYRQQAHFAKAFRRHTGLAPSDYRTTTTAPELVAA
jgi:AraC family transcriptional regulator of adaptative response / methylphosphotriester-DNA alkyltransferase methyltransferase